MSREEAADAGHFTTLQVRGGRVQGLDLHLARLVAASRELYGTGPGRSALKEHIRGALEAAGRSTGDCTARVRVLPPSRIEVDVEPPRQPSASPLRVRTHPGLRSLPSVKHLALDFQLGARRQARDAGFDDALLLAPDGRISEGTFWNIAFGDGDAVVWPDAPALPGVTQRLLGGALEKAGVPQRREAVGVDSLAGLRAAFALNSTGIADIAAIDSHAFRGDARAGATLRALLAGVPWEGF